MDRVVINRDLGDEEPLKTQWERTMRRNVFRWILGSRWRLQRFRMRPDVTFPPLRHRLRRVL